MTDVFVTNSRFAKRLLSCPAMLHLLADVQKKVFYLHLQYRRPVTWDTSP